MDWICSPEAWTALVTLTVLEIILGVDNIIIVSIIARKLPEAQRKTARTLGLVLAMVMRIGLLFALSWIIGLNEPLVTVGEYEYSGKELLLIFGGLFLVLKSTHEIIGKLSRSPDVDPEFGTSTFGWVLGQIVVLNLVFSIDSVILAVGIADDIVVMVVAVVVSVAVMIVSAEPIAAFVEQHPSVKLLALALLVLIGFKLVAEGFGWDFDNGYFYVAMVFALVLEGMNMRLRTLSPSDPGSSEMV